MTNTQKKIQKSSKVLSILFLLFLFSCIVQGSIALWRMLFILLNPARAVTLSLAQYPFASLTYVALCQLGFCLAWLCYGAAFTLLYRIFRDIHREYTPFQNLHVHRLRWAAGYLTVVYALENGLSALLSLMQKGYVSFTLKLDYFLVPLTIIGLSYILDYACQLQNEVDTTL